MKKMCSFIIFLGFFSGLIHAGEQYNLEKAKQQVISDNINISIAYEQYVLIKGQERVKTLSLLPNLSISMLIMNYQYAILTALIPEPARFFGAAAQKDLAQAAHANSVIVKKNLLEDLETTLYLSQFHKEMVESFFKESVVSKDIAARSQEAYDLGAISFSDYYVTQRNVVSTKSQLISASEIVKSENFALKLILQVKDNTEALDFEKLLFYNETLDFPKVASEAADIAVNNSKEVEQFDYLIAAAKKQKKGVAISWISWGGVGFDYFARVSIANIEVKKLQLMKEKAIYEIRNQIVAQYAQLDSQKEKIVLQDQLLNMAKNEFFQAQASETNLLNSYINTKKAELNLMFAERESRQLHYELEIRFIKLKRLIGANMFTNVVPRS